MGALPPYPRFFLLKEEARKDFPSGNYFCLQESLLGGAPPNPPGRLVIGAPPQTPGGVVSNVRVAPKGALLYSLTLSQRLSVRGVLGAQPLGCTAKIDLWHRGPSRAPVPHETQGTLRSLAVE